MKSYMKPVLQYVTLSSEEKFAVGSIKCTVAGSCTDANLAWYQATFNVVVNFN